MPLEDSYSGSGMGYEKEKRFWEKHWAVSYGGKYKLNPKAQDSHSLRITKEK